MGAKDSKPSSISYEDAYKRVTDAEFKRLREAFKRASTMSGSMSKQAFMREVLGDGVPAPLSMYIFAACGGTAKGISFKDLLCSLVLLTSGKTDEKTKFTFGLYANESGSCIMKEEMHRVMQQTEGHVPEAVQWLFAQRGKVTYEDFREWLVLNRNATSVTRWIFSEPCTVSLSNDLETPTFYQTLAGVTHLEEGDIVALEKHYWVLKGTSRLGRLDLETVQYLITPPFPPSLCQRFFNAFDENCDNHIDFKEMACGISAACRGPLTERRKFCFKVFDADKDGMLSWGEVEEMARALLLVHKENRSLEELLNDPYADTDVQTVVQELRSSASSVNSKGIMQEEFLVWSVSNALCTPFLDLVFQICHIVFGLRPSSREEEGDIVRRWLDREESKGLAVNQMWYLVAMDWWKGWHEYVNCPTGSDALSLLSIPPTPPIPSSSSTGTSSPLYGSLKRSLLQKKATSLEGSLAIDTEKQVIVTSISSLAPDSLPHIGTSPKKSLSTPLNMISQQDSSRPSSATPSPTHSPRLTRKPVIIGGSTVSLGTSPTRPGAIDNTSLISPSPYRVSTLSTEGGRLRRNVVLMRGRDFELVPDALWRALHQWYGGAPALPRFVIKSQKSQQIELELYPLMLRIFRHQATAQSRGGVANSTVQAPWGGVMGGYGAAALSTTGYAYVPSIPQPPRRYLAYTASFSRSLSLKQVSEFLGRKLRLRLEDMRLWVIVRPDEISSSVGLRPLEEEELSLEEAGVQDDDQILLEVRNKDQTWPEEMGCLSTNQNSSARLRQQQLPSERGATGLNNLGNTCFMNAALQCVSNTQALTRYFMENMHIYEMNRSNPLGMRGHIAKRYGDLVQDIWSGTAKTVAPLKLRWTIGKYAPRFNGFQQHDSQELLAFLLDGLHEDLNRVQEKPYVELKDSDGRPDVVVAQEAWDNHLRRNRSIVVDLFHGQLKSKVMCKQCGHESVTFDPFNYLSLPLPMESSLAIEVLLTRLDGSVPTRYGLQLNLDERLIGAKQQLSILSGIPPQRLLLAEVANFQIKNVPSDDIKVQSVLSRLLYAYELPSSSLHHTEEIGTIEHPFTQIQRSTARQHRYSDSPALTSSSGYISHSSSVGEDSVGGDYDPPSVNGNGDSIIMRNNGNGDSINSDSPTPSPVPPLSLGYSISNGTESSVVGSSSGSTISNTPVNTSSASSSGDAYGFIIAFHRKMIRQEAYFLSSQKTRPALFGHPLIVPCLEGITSQQELYQTIWTQVSRLVSPLPPQETPSAPNHAQDCDDSLGYEFPFVLKAVRRDGLHCAWCPWYSFCRGCRIGCCPTPHSPGCGFLAIDWDPTALHLRYQSGLEHECIEHESVNASIKRQCEPIDLAFCLDAFTHEEHLGEDEKYFCAKCKCHQLASKKLQIWRLPPILIVHLKRFQFVQGKWVKSHKVVRFPFRDFDPTAYLASVPKLTVMKSQEPNVDHITSTTMTNGNVHKMHDSCDDDDHPNMPMSPNSNRRQRGRLESTSLYSHGPIDPNSLQDFHQHRLNKGSSPFQLKYHLYSIVCHSGILGGGHYVSYASNPNSKWYCYNDSSCREIQETHMDTSSAYMLFYEREGLNIEEYMPLIDASKALIDLRDLEEEMDGDLRKLCTIS